MDIKKLEKVIALLKTNKLSEIDMTSGKDHIRVVATPKSVPTAAVPMQGFAPQAAVAQAPATASDGGAKAEEITGHIVKSPFIGNYYSAASPGAAPFVKVGDQVKKGQSLCIVEAMKLMNEIESDKDGTITKIFLKNEDPVEFDQDLFIID